MIEGWFSGGQGGKLTKAAIYAGVIIVLLFVPVFINLCRNFLDYIGDIVYNPWNVRQLVL